MCQCGHALADHYTMNVPPGIDAWFCRGGKGRCACDSFRALPAATLIAELRGIVASMVRVARQEFKRPEGKDEGAP